MAGKGKVFEGGVNGPKPPCGKNCPDRKAGCACNCEKWAAYLAERNAEYERRAKVSENNRMSARRARDADRIAYKRKRNPGWH